MSNLIPPLMCSTPPPLEPLDDDDDEFGDFTTAVDCSYVCDTLSIPNTPLDTPKKEPILPVDINSNSHEDLVNEKDYQDKRKTEQFNNDQITMHINSLNTMPNLSDVPIEPMTEETVESDTTTNKVICNEDEDFENHSRIRDQNVPLYLNCTENVIGDFYREEPPEIIPDDPDEDFGDFEFNPIPILENEVTDEVSSTTSIPVIVNGELNSVTEFPNEENLMNSIDTGRNNSSIDATIILNEVSNVIECENEISSDKYFVEVDKINDKVLQNNQEICPVTVLENTNKFDDQKIKEELTYIDNEVDLDTCSHNCLEVVEANIVEGFSSYEKHEIVQSAVVGDDEFGDYTCTEQNHASNTDNSKTIITTDNSINSILPEESSCGQNDDFSEFADFKSAEEMGVITTSVPSLATTSAENDSSNEIENNFSASFASFEKNPSDDFGDFDDYTSSSPPILLSLNAQNIEAKAENIIKESFPEVPNNNLDFCLYDFIHEDGIFKEVKDITDTNALKYQWTKSQTQKSLLKSLNIDSRNILFGPGKNSSTPKFAANLGLTPLEPVKSEVLTTKPVRSSTPPSVASHSNSANTTSINDIPTAQFDWKESGLANPLDSVSKEEHQTLPQPELKPSCSTSEENFSTNAIVEMVENQSPLATRSSQIPVSETPRPNIKSYDSESVNSLQFADVEVEEIEKPQPDEFSDFASFQAPEKPSEFSGWSNNTVLLRESYINNTETRKVDNSDEPGWLKPTILTPVLPRKETFAEDDDFADFQMSLPTNKPALTVLPPSTNIINEESNVFADKLKTNNKTMLSPEVNPPINKLNTSTISTSNSIPINTILQPVSVFQPLDNDAFKINWPDPGVADVELDRFDIYSKSEECKKVNDIVPKSEILPERKLSGNTGSMLVEKSVVVPANKVVLPSKEVLLPPNDKVVISKDLVLPILESSPRKYMPMKSKADDDDWTDFISNPEPLRTVTKGHMERTSTPELSLSIPQLSSIQPPKLPIPVITPKGLMQTKIPSSVTMNNVQKNIAQTPLHIKPPQDGFQPSIISQQYAIQFNQNSFAGLLQNTNYQTTSIPANMKSPSHINPLQPKQLELANGTKSTTNTAFLDDNDEWSDFISSRPAIPESSTVNNIGADWNNSQQFWSNGMSTNLTNSHVQMGINKRAVNGTVSSKRNIPSISSLPDLDFAAPKNRTFNKK